jgi:hypothetical protein
MAMPERRKLELAADLILEPFDRRVGKLNDIPAVYADHVVVVRPRKFVLVTVTAVRKINFTREPHLFQQVKRAKNRGPPEPWVLGFQIRVDPFGCGVIMGAEKII